MKKLVMILAVVTMVLAVSGAAQATSNATIRHTLSWWATAGPQTIDDKIFTFVSKTGFVGTEILDVTTYSSFTGKIFVNVGSGANMPNATLDYKIAIDPKLSSGVFSDVSISVDRSIPLSLNITKTIAEEPTWSLTSLDGVSKAATIPGNHNSLTVHETMAGYWNGTTNMFTATTVPVTLVTLSSFTAAAQAGRVTLEWTTESEIDNAGFNIYRAVSENGEYVQINESIIPAQGSSTQGATYQIVDKGLQNRKTYYYKLEDIDLNGNSTMHGPVSATPRFLLGIFNF
jgi:hypothetical protein